MRKSICFFLVALSFISAKGYAQSVADTQPQTDLGYTVSNSSLSYADTENLRKKYFHLSYSSTKLIPDGTGSDWGYRSKYGVSLTFGKSYYLHKNPIARMLYIGIDATWIDLTYTYYKYNMGDLFGGMDFGMDEEDMYIKDYQAEIAMQVGPSIHVYPVGKMHIEAYFRYAPTFSLLVEDGNFGGNYATYFVSGGAVSYHCIGLGAEARFGSCKYKSFGGDGEDGTGGKTKLRGYRVYLSFRF